MVLLSILLGLSVASDVGGKEVLQQLEPSTRSKPSLKREEISEPPKLGERKPTSNMGGNLDPSLIRARGAPGSEKNGILRPKEGVRSHAIDVVVGDIFNCRILQDIIGYVGAVSPVRAEILEGRYKGYFFVGNATMDPKTKHILVQFHKIRSPTGDKIVKITATVHSTSGELGLKGTVTSHYWQYFFASVLSSTAEGYADATVARQRDFFGQFQNVPTEENAAKQGVAKGASATAEVMAEKMKSAPEYTTVRGPITTKIFIIDDIKS